MKKDIRMIGLDLDGTTLVGHTTITPRVKQAIEAALRQGIVVLPATGRQYGGLPQPVLDIQGIEYALTSNGAKIYNLPLMQEIYSDCFEKQTALELYDILSSYHALMGIYIDGKGYDRHVEEMEGSIILPELVEYIKATRVFVPDMEQLIRESNKPVEKFTLMFHRWADLEHARGRLAQRSDNYVSSGIANGLEVNTPTANKGRGLLMLAEKLGIHKDQVMAIGDSSNDVEMLKAVGYGVAMGNATAEVKAVASTVTLPCEEDGVAVAIEAIL